jgi:hypothetical protein
MRRPLILVSVLILTIWLGCKADTVWQQDCGAFVKELASLATKAGGDNASGYASRLEGKEVTWVLSFKEIGKDKDGNDSLLFDVEPYGIRHEFFSGEPVMLGFKPAPGTSESWKATPTGARVKISAVVANVIFAHLSPGDNPSKTVFIAAASLENVRRVSD